MRKEKRNRKEWGQEMEEAIDGVKVQYNYPGTFQGWYVKPAHCAAVDNMTASSSHTRTPAHTISPLLHKEHTAHSNNNNKNCVSSNHAMIISGNLKSFNWCFQLVFPPNYANIYFLLWLYISTFLFNVNIQLY